MSAGRQKTRRRLGGISKIRKVTAAMHRVAAARLNNDRRAMQNANLYNEKLLEILREVCVAAPDFRHILLDERPQDNVEVAVFSSDFGMCGGFNTQLVDKLKEFKEADPERKIKLTSVGKIAGRIARRNGIAVKQIILQPQRENRVPAITALSAQINQDFVSRKINGAYVLFSRDINGLKQEAVIEPLLPVPFGFPEGHQPKLAAALFEPSVENVLEHLLGEYISQALDRAFLNSLAAENAARKAAMTRATENAAEAQDEIEKLYRRMRQGDITNEMLEIGAHVESQ